MKQKLEVFTYIIGILCGIMILISMGFPYGDWFDVTYSGYQFFDLLQKTKLRTSYNPGSETAKLVFKTTIAAWAMVGLVICAILIIIVGIVGIIITLNKSAPANSVSKIPLMFNILLFAQFIIFVIMDECVPLWTLDTNTGWMRGLPILILLLMGVVLAIISLVKFIKKKNKQKNDNPLI